ncbi:MAG TPA: hypothetical protein VIM75_17775, partial [Ohtaekwangia sp.]|uniref:hypothetical protein n=1 Tax=Ohtaekwangia sp. TaxID=2066019 RepID=UPI002F954E01
RCESEFVRFTKWQAHLNNHFLEVFASENFKEMIIKKQRAVVTPASQLHAAFIFRAPILLL